MSHYDNHIEDFGPKLPENYDPGIYASEQRNTARHNYHEKQAEVSTDEPVPDRPRIRPGSKQRIGSERQATDRKRKKEQPQPDTREHDTDMASSGFVKFFTDHRTHKFFGLLLVGLSLFLAIVTVSHLRSGAADQSMAMNSTMEEMAKLGNTQNVGGPVGAKISYTIVTRWLGLGAIPFIAYFAVIGLSLLGIRKCRFWNATFQTLLIGITTSVVMGLISDSWATAFAWGGEHGRFVNKFLIDYTGYPGAICVSIFLTGAIVCVYYNYISAFIKARRAEYNARRERRIQARQELERQRAEAEATLAAANSPLADEPETEAEETRTTENETDNETETADPNDNSYINLDEIDYMDNMAAAADCNYTGSGEKGFTVDEAIDMPAVNPVAMAAAAVHTEDNHEAQAKEPEKNQENNPAAFMPEPEHKEPLTPNDAPLSIETVEIEKADDTESPLYDPTAELSRYVKPTIDLLEDRPDTGANIDVEEQEANKQRIIKTLLEYGIPISDIKATVGPTITLFEIVPAEGVRTASIRRLEDDIARSLAAEGIRIVAPIPGRDTVGIEVPNHTKHTVSMRSIISSKKYQECNMALPMAIGITISNDIYIRDLAKIPHLLVAGATGQGKSVGLNAIIASLIYKRHPAELKFVLIDPKMVEFSLYSKLERHFLAKIEGEDDAIVTDPEKVKATLNSLCIEMDNRYRLLKDAFVRSLEEYNQKFINHRLNPEKGHKYLPYIVVVVDEFADLIMMAGKEIEMPIARIAQKARAVGIHLIIATQRPSTNVITGMIKANFPGRMAFRVAQMVDSRTILDRPGANSLIGKGDMLFSWNSSVDRVQCAFISTEEVTAICDWIDSQAGYSSAYYLPEYIPDATDAPGGGGIADRDSLFEDCATFVVTSGTASTSSLQRKFAIGYNRAGKIMDQLEAARIVGPANGGKPRAILVDSFGLENILRNN